MPAIRRHTYKQETPRAQLVVLLMAAEGHVSNCIEIEYTEERIKKALTFLHLAQEIIEGMPEGEWKGQ